ncbi:hypothetical protein B0A52_03892 [Exophiala mesophila]|uniref:Uncharacterized protein n=1 Tax=Exophiala mesophila TaxID=212818 RepID=A0A438N7S5_EXOME|nr:hypothetical protein B0A52_03892 [Exophiala mesophila]
MVLKNKKRLYVALYPSGVVDNESRKYGYSLLIAHVLKIGPRYHWGYLVGPKVEDKELVPEMRYHVKSSPADGWIYEEVALTNVKSTNNLLVRILIAKIEDEARLVDILRNTPLVQDGPDWRCRSWIADAMLRIENDGKAVGTAV